MRCRDHVALTLPSLLLRLVLGITFLWAGAGKIIGTTTVEGDNAARLANLGVPFIQETVDEAIDEAVDETVDGAVDGTVDGDGGAESSIPDEPMNPIPGVEVPDAADVEEGAELVDPVEPVDIFEPPPVDLPVDPAVDADEIFVNPVAIRNISLVTSPAVGSDFLEPVKIKRVYGIALLLDKSVSPELTADSQPVTPTMPSWLGGGSMPVYAAWGAAITELVAGLFLLFGFLTRISGLSLCVVMLVAVWTTQIGPASLQSSDAILGFIPNAADVWDPSSYSSLLWQLALVAMSLSVVLLGAGPLSMDRVFFRPGRRDPYVSGESQPKPVAPKPVKAVKARPQDVQKDRSEFDRAPPPPQSNPTP